MAGVLLQKLIIEATPASCDQDHLEVVCFTNPKIPDRTDSLLNDGGSNFARGIIDSLKILESTGVDVVAIPCHTAHARIKEIQRESNLPIMSMVKITTETLSGEKGKIGILATTGTIREKMYGNHNSFNILEPGKESQKKIMKLAYRIKAGETIYQSEIEEIAADFKNLGAQALLLACTEFSLYYENFANLGLKIFDPLRILASHLVNSSQKNRTEWNLTPKSNKISINEGDYPAAVRH